LSVPLSPHLFSNAPLSPRFFSSAPSSPRPFYWVRLRAFTSFWVRLWAPTFFECGFEPSTILLSAPSSPHFPFSFYLGRSSITMGPFSLYFFHLGRSPITMRPLLKKKRGEGFSQLFFFTKLIIQSQKKISFLMPLHRKHCKKRATVVTKFWPIGF
jgi:hypothetical protein